MKTRPSPDAVSIELEVPFHDVDSLHVVWHGWYCKYLELARTALLRSRCIDAPDMIRLGFKFFVIETHLRHLGPARYGDRLRVTSWFTEVENRIGISYVIDNLTGGKRCSLGATVLVTTDQAGALCYETPTPVLERLRAPGPGRFG
jgi:acyl-CoA thioester hydrolase